MRRALAIAAAAAGALLALAPADGAQERARWDTRLLARVPPPGFPALGYVHPNGRIYEGTFVNPGGDSQRSRVLEYDGDGTLIRSWTVQGQDLSKDHGVQVATSDRQGRLILLDRNPARALILDRRTGTFQELATFADLPACPGGMPQDGCSPTLEDREAMANYGAWGPDGSLYVTDFLQGVVWRVPPGGGAAQVWLADRRLDGGEFGTTGIALGPDRRTLFVAQGSSAGLAGLNPTTGKLYSVPIQPDGRPGELSQLWESAPTDLPDGFAIARSGSFYVPLAGGPNQIAVLAPDGRELERFPSSPGGDNGSPVPFDTPSSARFLGTRLIVANQSFSGNREHQALLDVEVREPGLPEFIPGLDRTAPVLSRVSFTHRVFRVRRRGRAAGAAARRPGRGTRIRFRLSERATVSFRIERRRGRGWRHVRTFDRRQRAGRRSVALSGRVRIGRRARALRAGRYRLRLRARDGARNRSRRVTRRFRIVR